MEGVHSVNYHDQDPARDEIIYNGDPADLLGALRDMEVVRDVREEPEFAQ